jgi:hypothetical protein
MPCWRGLELGECTAQSAYELVVVAVPFVGERFEGGHFVLALFL